MNCVVVIKIATSMAPKAIIFFDIIFTPLALLWLTVFIMVLLVFYQKDSLLVYLRARSASCAGC
jgi:Zn-dependent membrane protease YugP